MNAGRCRNNKNAFAVSLISFCTELYPHGQIQENITSQVSWSFLGLLLYEVLVHNWRHLSRMMMPKQPSLKFIMWNQSLSSANQPIILWKLIVPLLSSSLPFGFERVAAVLSLKKKAKQKVKFDFVTVLRTLLCTLYAILMRWMLFLRSSFCNILNLPHWLT